MMPGHEYRDSEFHLDVCGFEDPETRQMCGAPRIHPWHGYDRVEKTILPSHRRRIVHDRRRVFAPSAALDRLEEVRRD